jgi:hypothetical protein
LPSHDGTEEGGFGGGGGLASVSVITFPPQAAVVNKRAKMMGESLNIKPL